MLAETPHDAHRLESYLWHVQRGAWARIEGDAHRWQPNAIPFSAARLRGVAGAARSHLTLDVINGLRYACSVIRSFRDSETQKIFERSRSRRFSAGVQKLALRKLLILDAAESLDDLRVPPGNRLEKLKGNREGQHSVRVNDQWRVCFVWKDGDAHEVEVVDYH